MTHYSLANESFGDYIEYSKMSIIFLFLLNFFFSKKNFSLINIKNKNHDLRPSKYYLSSDYKKKEKYILE